MAGIDPSETDALPPAAASQSTTAPYTPSLPLPTTLPGRDPPTLTTIYGQLITYPFYADTEFLAGLAAILGHPDVPATPEELRTNSDLVLQARCFYLSRRFNIEPPIEPAGYLAWSKERVGTGLPNVQGPEFNRAGGDVVESGQSVSLNQEHIQSGSATDGPQLASEPPGTTTAASSTFSATTSAPQSQPQSSGPEPTYPPSFAAIVDLITQNLPIPGIEDVPPTILEPGTSKIDHTPRRRKPWEKDASTGEVFQEEASADIGREGTRGQATDIDSLEDASVAAEEVKELGKSDLNGHLASGEGVVKILQPNAIPPSGLLSHD